MSKANKLFIVALLLIPRAVLLEISINKYSSCLLLIKSAARFKLIANNYSYIAKNVEYTNTFGLK